MALKIGDIVVLKSGGPKMTVVSSEDPQGRVSCSWFAGAKAERGVYHVEAIEPPKEEPKK